jgi:hypothetical protein
MLLLIIVALGFEGRQALYYLSHAFSPPSLLKKFLWCWEELNPRPGNPTL